MSYIQLKNRKFRIIIMVILISISSFALYKQRSLGWVFDKIYEEGLWGEDNTGRGWSGLGSRIEANSEYIKFIEGFIVENKIRSIVDAGCGDWTFSKEINWHSANYLGVDVSSIVIDHVKQYETDRIRFMLSDATESLPPADLLLCKDVLQHLSNKLVKKFIDNNLQPGKYKWAIITNDLLKSGENTNISPGEYRMLDLSKPPFNLNGLKNLPISFGNDYKYAQYKTAQLIKL